MRLLGENLVMLRDSQGRMGALDESCPPRGASLYFGRNEEGGLRCACHGWKFVIDGVCLDTPTEQPDRRALFCSRMKAKAYPCHEVNHMVWIYMGPRQAPPPFPAFEINLLSSDHVAQPRIMMEEANWLRNMEGDPERNRGVKLPVAGRDLLLNGLTLDEIAASPARGGNVTPGSYIFQFGQPESVRRAMQDALGREITLDGVVKT
ncbi:MAG: hypothetical protein EXR07_15900 [Acetobacteraceae bacterium]|nr:hypothetical protein [Acetobacteraceae bacterium]